MEFSEDTLKSVVVRVSENGVWAIAFVGAAFNETVPSKQRKSCSRSARDLEQCGKAVGTQSIPEVEIYFLSPSCRLAGGSLEIRSFENRRLRIRQRLAFENQFKSSIAEIDPINAAKVILNLPKRSAQRGLMQVGQHEFGKMGIRFCWSFHHLQIFQLFREYRFDVQVHLPLDCLPECRCADRPLGSKPESGAFHPHSEFAQTGTVGWYLRRPKRSRKIREGNASSIIAHDDLSTVIRINFDLDTQFVVLPLCRAKLAFVVEVTLDGVVHELGESKPRLVVQVLQNGKHTDARTDVDLMQRLRLGHARSFDQIELLPPISRWNRSPRALGQPTA